MDPSLYLFVIAPVIGLIGLAIGSIKGNGLFGFVLSLLLGPLGWLLVLLASDKRKKCPHCAGPLGEGKVTRCKNCGGSLVAAKPVAAPVPQQVVDPIEAWEQRQKSGKQLPKPGSRGF